MKPIPGVVTGIVKSLDDPDGLGRIQLTFPWMSASEPVSYWARIAAPMAGAGRGVQLMPEIDDEVLVAFDHGDVRAPYIVGFLWNGEDAPPRSDPAQRVIQTVSGHVLEFDDTEGGEKISLLFKGGEPSITLEQSKISIQFDASTSIELSPSGVTVKGAMIELN